MTSAQGSQDGIHTCITQVGTPTCSSAHLQNQLRAQSDEGARWGAYLHTYGPSGRSSVGPEPALSKPTPDVASQPT